MSDTRAETHYQQGLEAKAKNDLDVAVYELRRAIHFDSRHAKAYQELGWLTYAKGENLRKAQDSLERSIQLDPSLSDAHMYLAIIMNRLGRTDDSEAMFKISLSLTEDFAIVHSTFAEEFLWHNSRYGEAEHHFKLALKHDPDCVLALRDYARMLACHGRDTEAKRYFEKALHLSPTDRHTKHAYDEFKRDIMADDRNPDDCLRAAIGKDPNYSEGVKYLSSRGG